MKAIYNVSLAWVAMCSSLPAQESTTKQVLNMLQAAKAIKIGASREEVIKILGPAKWVILPEDKNSDGSPILLPGKSLKLVWDTPGCVPIQVLFDGKYKVWGVGGGLQLLTLIDPQRKEEQKAVNPSEDFLAKDGQRLKLSRLHTEKPKQAEPAGTNQPTAASESKPEGKDKPQPEPKPDPR